MTGLADVDGFLLFTQVCMWPRFPPLMKHLWENLNVRELYLEKITFEKRMYNEVILVKVGIV